MLQPTTKNKFIVAFVCFALTLVFSYVYYIRYFRFRDCTDGSLTNCTVEGVEIAASSGSIWAVPPVIFAMLAVDRMLKALRARKKDLEESEASA